MVDPRAEADKLAEQVALRVGGQLYDVWTSITISRSLDSLAGTFEFQLANRLRDQDAPLSIKAGDRCQVMIGGEVAMDGWVDRKGPTRSDSDAGISISGRDRTGDLADCSAIAKPGSWANMSIEAIANELTKPFGIKVTAKTSTGGRIPKFALQPSETVQAAIERLLRFRGLLMQPTATGDLEIITPETGAPATTLAIGVNIKSIEATHDHSERFSDYLVKGQSVGDDKKHGKTVSQVKGEAKDSAIKRYRPLMVVAEDQVDGASASSRAKFEAGVRAGKGVSAEIVVLGWRVTAGGKLWRPNVPVTVKAPAEDLPGNAMIITAATLSKDDQGTLAQLTVMPPGAWAQLADKGALK